MAYIVKMSWLGCSPSHLKAELPATSIHSLEQLVKDLCEAFDRYDYQYVCDIIDFQNLILLSFRYTESEPSNDSLSPTFSNHETP